MGRLLVYSFSYYIFLLLRVFAVQFYLLYLFGCDVVVMLHSIQCAIQWMQWYILKIEKREWYRKSLGLMRVWWGSSADCMPARPPHSHFLLSRSASFISASQLFSTALDWIDSKKVNNLLKQHTRFAIHPIQFKVIGLCLQFPLFCSSA